MSFVDCQNGSLSLVAKKGKKKREKREKKERERQNNFCTHVYKNVEMFSTHTHECAQVC